MAVQVITQDSFKSDVIDQKGFVFVDFFATWCQPCKMTEPIVEDLSGEVKNMKFVKIDVDQAVEISSQYSILSVPTFMIFKDGQVAHQFVGAMPKEGFMEEINKATA